MTIDFRRPRGESVRAAPRKELPLMSVVPGPVLISIGALVGLVAISWLFTAWLQDHYSVPLSGSDDHTRAESSPE